MRAPRSRFLPILVLSGLLAFIPTAHAATSGDAPRADAPAVTYPQIVRLSYVEGDVRVSRGKLAEKLDGAAGGTATGWEDAVADLPLESGYSLVTGAGRAEIELEDASAVYLGVNSVLTFSELSSTDGVPYTEMALLSGTATLDVETLAPGERLTLNTPTDTISMRYPQKSYVRVNSFLDAMAVTPQRPLSYRLLGLATTREQAAGETTSFRNGIRLAALPVIDPAASTQWDQWVAARVAARGDAMSATMKDAGLTAPVPGLADMNGQGTFFSCAPYGKCWEPAKGWNGEADQLAKVDAQVSTSRLERIPDEPGRPAAQTTQRDLAQELEAEGWYVSPKSRAYLASHPGVTLRTEDYAFPCAGTAVEDLVARDPATGEERTVGTQDQISTYWPLGVRASRVRYSPLWLNPYAGMYPGTYPYLGNYPWNWAVCHTGSWIRWGHRYVWVAGVKRHHHRPIKWVKNGHTVGFVPIHPRDVAGKPPINLKDGLLRPGKKDDLREGKAADGAVPRLERVDLDEGKPMKLLAEPPREFRKEYVEPLHVAEAPKAEAYSAYGGALVAVTAAAMAKGSAIERAAVPVRENATGREGTPISFDRKSQSFVMATLGMQRGRPSMVVAPVMPRSESSQGRPGEASSMVRGSNSGGGESRPAPSSPSYSNAGNASRPSAPSYTPPPSYNAGAAEASHPTFSAPSSGGSSGGGSQAAAAPPHK